MNGRIRYMMIAALIWCAFAWLFILTGWAAGLPDWIPLASFLMTMVLANNWYVEE